MHTREISLNSKTLRFETGKLAKQAHGSVIVRYGDSVVLVTACHAASSREGIDFRPLFPSGWRYETQVIALVLSADGENDTDVLAITGASAALALSDIPFEKTIAGVRVGLVDGQYVINPSFEQRKTSKIDLVVAGTSDGIVMVEAGAKEVTEPQVVEALQTAHN